MFNKRTQSASSNLIFIIYFNTYFIDFYNILLKVSLQYFNKSNLWPIVTEKFHSEYQHLRGYSGNLKL